MQQVSSTPAERLDVSVVLPVFRNAPDLRPLHAEISAVLAGLDLTYELVFVDDASPDDSAGVLAALARSDPATVVVTLPRNAGQHRAVLEGIRRARGERVAVMDADGQDPPDALPLLLSHLDAGAHAVFAGRRGTYQSAGRHVTSRAFKSLLSLVARVPADAGMYLVMDGRMRQALLALPDPPPFVVALVGLTRLPVESVPVERRPRARGSSAYGALKRTSTGAGAIARVLAWRLSHGVRAEASAEAHNAAQREYYETAEHPNMRPRQARHTRRQIEVALAAAQISPRDRVLEIGAGEGRFTRLLADRLPRLESSDLSPVLLERLAATCADRPVPLHVLDVADPPDRLQASFDAVAGFFMLHHLHDLAASFHGIASMLRPGGRVVFVEPNPLNVLYYVQMLVTPGMSFAGDRGILRMRPRVLADAMRAAGLTPGPALRFGFFPPFVSDTPFGQRLERILERFPLWRPLLPFLVFTATLPPSATPGRPPTLTRSGDWESVGLP